MRKLFLIGVILGLAISPALGGDRTPGQKAQGRIDHDRDNIAGIGRLESHLEADKASQIGHARFGAAAITQGRIDGLDAQAAGLRADVAATLAGCPTCH